MSTTTAETQPQTPETTTRKGSQQSKLGKLLDLRRHTDHKVLGVSYVVAFTLTVFYMLTDINAYESSILLHVTSPIIGVLVSMSALRNFRFLPKQAENPGMFAKNRTFSYAFLKENLWFQFLIGFTLFSGHPLASQYISHDLMLLIIFGIFAYREFVPKTSYSSWEVGNNKVNTRFNGWVTFINLQVKLVRWNYVAKKTYLFYLVLLVQAEYFLGLGKGAYVSQSDRVLFYLLCLDAMHNITTAFFFQTLKFKGFISAETFSFLFNVSPLIGIYLTYLLLTTHTIVVPFALAGLVELYVNLEFIYPNKTLSFEWKNRCQVASKFLCSASAFAYTLYTSSS